jgi:hypothetical protein
MLSGILRSNKATEVNILIMRAFVFIRQYALSNKEISEKLNDLEKNYNKQFSDVHEALNYLTYKDKANVETNFLSSTTEKIGYKSNDE